MITIISDEGSPTKVTPKIAPQVVDKYTVKLICRDCVATMRLQTAGVYYCPNCKGRVEVRLETIRGK